MRKSLVLALMTVGSGASYAAGLSTVGVEFQKSDPSTWRWHVSSILEQQKTASSDAFAAVDPGIFRRHERYSPLGVPDAGHRAP
jgi:hypothetical protein